MGACASFGAAEPSPLVDAGGLDGGAGDAPVLPDAGRSEGGCTSCPTPVLAYDFEDPPVPGKVTDLSPNHNDGTVTQPRYVPGIRGQALQFDAPDDDAVTWVEVPDGPTLDLPKLSTFAFFVRFDRATDWDQVLLGKPWIEGSEVDPAYQYEIERDSDSGELRFRVGDPTVDAGQGDLQELTFVQAAVGSWIHVAFVRNGATTAAYLNGVKVAEPTVSRLVTRRPTRLYLGRDAEGTQALVATLDELRIYEAPLSADQIAQLARR